MNALSALCLALGLAACGGDGSSPTPAPSAAPARRIVVVAPAAAEMLDALGAADRIVGIGDYVTEPESIAGLPRVGAYDSPNVEVVLSLEADMLMTAASEAALPSNARLESLGVHVLALDTSTYEGVYASLAEVGRAVGREHEAQDVARRMRDELAGIARRVEGLPRKSVLFVVGKDPIYVAGPGSHLDQMIALAGGTNVAHDVGSAYARLSMEAILERAPEVIIDTSDNREQAPLGRRPGSWSQWEFLPAVRDDRVYHVAPSRLVIPGMRLPEMTRLTASLLHPEVFGEAAEADLRPR